MLILPGAVLHVFTGSLFSMMKLCWICYHSYSHCILNRQWTSLNTKFIASAAALMTGLRLLWFQGWVCFSSSPLWSHGSQRGCESPSRLPAADAGACGCISNGVRRNQHLAGDLSAAALVFLPACRGCSLAPVGKTKVKVGFQTDHGIGILPNKNSQNRKNAAASKALNCACTL